MGREIPFHHSAGERVDGGWPAAWSAMSSWSVDGEFFTR